MKHLLFVFSTVFLSTAPLQAQSEPLALLDHTSSTEALSLTWQPDDGAVSYFVWLADKLDGRDNLFESVVFRSDSNSITVSMNAIREHLEAQDSYYDGILFLQIGASACRAEDSDCLHTFARSEIHQFTDDSIDHRPESIENVLVTRSADQDSFLVFWSPVVEADIAGYEIVLLDDVFPDPVIDVGLDTSLAFRIDSLRQYFLPGYLNETSGEYENVPDFYMDFDVYVYDQADQYCRYPAYASVELYVLPNIVKVEYLRNSAELYLEWTAIEENQGGYEVWFATDSASDWARIAWDVRDNNMQLGIDALMAMNPEQWLFRIASPMPEYKNNIRWSEILYVDVSTVVTPELHLQTGMGQFALEPNYPNPFKSSTKITYQLPIACAVRLVIFNAAGLLIEVLVDAYKHAGSHSVAWHPVGLPAGNYFYRIDAPGYSESRSCTLLMHRE